MKILYLSCHEILEHDELALFTEMGHEVFSPAGAFQNPQAEGGKRPPIKDARYEEYLSELALGSSRENLHPGLIEWADAIIYMHMPRNADGASNWIESNWPNVKHKINIFRAIGQNTEYEEKILREYKKEGLKIVRYSPKEENIPHYAGSDAMIRFYKSPEEFQGWRGDSPFVFNVTQSMKSRGESCNYEFFLLATNDLPLKVAGPNNENFGDSYAGTLSYDDLKENYRANRVYCYSGTQPASYTLNFIEAWMTGIPVVAIGPKHGNSLFRDQQTYEVSDLIENEVSGFWSDKPNELSNYLKVLLNDWSLAQKIGQKGREKAIELFGKETIKSQWEQFFKTL